MPKFAEANCAKRQFCKRHSAFNSAAERTAAPAIIQNFQFAAIEPYSEKVIKSLSRHIQSFLLGLSLLEQRKKGSARNFINDYFLSLQYSDDPQIRRQFRGLVAKLNMSECDLSGDKEFGFFVDDMNVLRYKF